MKPQWSDAPAWANYLAMDGNLEWHWYENEPYASGEGYWVRRPNDGLVIPAGRTYWHDEIEERP